MAVPWIVRLIVFLMVVTTVKALGKASSGQLLDTN